VPYLDLIVIVLFLLFTFIMALMISPLSNLLKQSERTLEATETLIRTLDKELGPTLNEVNLVLGSVQEFKAIAEQRITDVGTKVEDVTGNITKVADQAKSHTSIWGAGLMAGFKAYLDGKPVPKESVENKVKSTSRS
jgi:methyl-accepting chemotaxis protein